MTITLNGKPNSDQSAALSVAALLDKLGLSGKPVIVELNGTALRPREFENSEVADGAVVEIVRVAAGG